MRGKNKIKIVTRSFVTLFTAGFHHSLMKELQAKPPYRVYFVVTNLF